jgi:hypothetical protein
MVSVLPTLTKRGETEKQDADRKYIGSLLPMILRK